MKADSVKKDNKNNNIIFLLCVVVILLLCTNINYCNKSNEYESLLESRDRQYRIERSTNSPSQTQEYKTSKGYADDPDYEPTVDDNGEYHTIDGKRNQVQFQGSKEQADQLEEMNKRGW